MYLEDVCLQLGLLPEGLAARLADLLRHGRLLVHPLDVLVDGTLDKSVHIIYNSNCSQQLCRCNRYDEQYVRTLFEL